MRTDYWRIEFEHTMKSDSIAIQVENVSKQFKLGSNQDYSRLTEAIVGKLRLLFSATRRLSKHTDQTDQSLQASPHSFWVLRDVNFTIHSGEVVGIVGRNGAGKSTLLKILSRIITPTKGRVGVRGRVGSLLEVGTGFHPELTGRENVFLNGAILGLPRSAIRKQFDAIVAFAEIGPFLDTPVKRYSTGMSVRLGFSVAAHLEPDVLIIDEVLSVGDQAFQRKCMGKASELGHEGRTVLMVSHNLAAVANMCDRAILIESGNVTADDLPHKVIDQYLADTRGQDGRIDWDDPATAPSTEFIRVHSIAVRGHQSETSTAEVDIDCEIILQVKYEILQDDVQNCVQIHLKDETGVFVFSTANAPSMNLDRDEWYARPHARGRYKSECRIPPNFLNDTRYFVSVIFGPEIGNPSLRLESALSFVVHDTGAMRKEYIGSWVGPVIRPRLAWKTQKIVSAATR